MRYTKSYNREVVYINGLNGPIAMFCEEGNLSANDKRATRFMDELNFALLVKEDHEEAKLMSDADGDIQ